VALTHIVYQLVPVSPKGIDIVLQDFCPLMPRGLMVEAAMLEGSGASITVHTMTKVSVFPGCGTPAKRVHSDIVGVRLQGARSV
jgi:hypothetical protein